MKTWISLVRIIQITFDLLLNEWLHNKRWLIWFVSYKLSDLLDFLIVLLFLSGIKPVFSQPWRIRVPIVNKCHLNIRHISPLDQLSNLIVNLSLYLAFSPIFSLSYSFLFLRMFPPCLYNHKVLQYFLPVYFNISVDHSLWSYVKFWVLSIHDKYISMYSAQSFWLSDYTHQVLNIFTFRVTEPLSVTES